MVEKVTTLDYRLFRSIEWKPWRTTFNLEFADLPGEPCNCLAQLPHWVYLIMVRKAHKALEDVGDALMMPSVFEYWLTRLAAEYVKEPVHYNHLWSFSDEATCVAIDKRCRLAPTIWYDYTRREIRAGVDYDTAKWMSFDAFRKMSEEEAVAWMDGDWRPGIKQFYIDEHKTTRIL